MQVLIIDDEKQAREALRSMLTDYCSSVTIAGEADGVVSGVEAIRKIRPDLVLLDIQMKDGTGFDLLDKVKNPGFRLIFTTAHDEFALRAFRYHAIDYLLKPIDPDQLIEAVEKIAESNTGSPLMDQISSLFESLEGKRMEKLALPSQEGISYLKLDDILYLKADGNYTMFYTISGNKEMVTKALKDYEEMLPEDTFFRIHQSYIVHADQVKQFRRDESIVLMTNNDQLPVAKRRRQDFLNWLKDM